MSNNEIKTLLNHVNNRVTELKAELIKREAPQPIQYSGSGTKKAKIDIDTYIFETVNMIELNTGLQTKLNNKLKERGVK